MQSDLTRVLFETLDNLSSAHTFQDVVRALKHSARTLARADGATVMLRDGAHVHSLDEDAPAPIGDGPRLPLGSCVGGWAILNRRYAIVEEARSDSRLSPADDAGSQASSMVVVPIRSADPIGALCVYWSAPQHVDRRLVVVLQTLANAAAIAIENTRLYGWLEVAYRSARQQAQKYSNLVNTVNGVVWEAHPGALGFSFVSEQAERLLGYPNASWTASDNFWLDHVHPDDRVSAADLRRRPMKPGDRQRFEYRMIAADGRSVWVSDYVSVGPGADHVECLHGVMVDITEQKTIERQLAWHALYDPLTGLPNRALFLDQAEKDSHRVNGFEPGSLAILFIDLDRFKQVNDSFGHLAGDALLMGVAARLRKTCRESETVARLSGDEFALLAPGAGFPEKATAIANRIHGLFSQPFSISGSSLYLSASIGVALALGGLRRPARDLLREADTAMYRAKNSGGARVEFFDTSMREDAVSRLRLETEMRHAITRREFVLHYQPIVEMASREVLGFEALVRWPHPRRGLLHPAEFLTAVEDLGFWNELTHQTLSMACATLRRWSRRDADQPWISVNLGPAQLQDPKLPRLVRSVLDINSVPPGCLKLEITEAALVQTEAAMRESLHQLHALGVGIMIDDFGTGTSSFSRLLDAPVDAIKIDRRFVEELTTPDSSAFLLRSIVSLGRNLNVTLIAEGVENEVQFLGLRELGCNAAQGFYFAHPEPLDEAELLIA